MRTSLYPNKRFCTVIISACAEPCASSLAIYHEHTSLTLSSARNTFSMTNNHLYKARQARYNSGKAVVHAQREQRRA